MAYRSGNSPRKLPQEAVPGRKTWAVTANGWRLSAQLCELKTPGDPVIGNPQFCEVFLREQLNQVLTVRVREKSPPASGRGGEMEQL